MLITKRGKIAKKREKLLAPTSQILWNLSASRQVGEPTYPLIIFLDLSHLWAEEHFSAAASGNTQPEISTDYTHFAIILEQEQLDYNYYYSCTLEVCSRLFGTRPNGDTFAAADAATAAAPTHALLGVARRSRQRELPSWGLEFPGINHKTMSSVWIETVASNWELWDAAGILGFSTMPSSLLRPQWRRLRQRHVVEQKCPGLALVYCEISWWAELPAGMKRDEFQGWILLLWQPLVRKFGRGKVGNADFPAVI